MIGFTPFYLIYDWLCLSQGDPGCPGGDGVRHGQLHHQRDEAAYQAAERHLREVKVRGSAEDAGSCRHRRTRVYEGVVGEKLRRGRGSRGGTGDVRHHPDGRAGHPS